MADANDTNPGGDAAVIKQMLAEMASSSGPGRESKAEAQFIPLWKKRPAGSGRRLMVNPGMVGDDPTSPGGGRLRPGRVEVEIPVITDEDFATQDMALGSFLDLSDEDREEFQTLALRSGLLRPSEDGYSGADLMAAWNKATLDAATYNRGNSDDKWISPWEAAEKMALGMAAKNGGAYDPFKPKTTTQRSTRKVDFTKGEAAGDVSQTLESMFTELMGRAPTEEERSVYQRLVQTAYDASPETATQTTVTDWQGNSTSNTVQQGGIDMTTTMLDKVREDPEAEAFLASQYFEAVMNSLGAIA